MKKSIFSFILAMVCVLSIVACSGGGGPKQTPPCTENCEEPIVDDGSTMEKAVPVIVGTSQRGIKKEEAYYSVDLLSGERYRFLVSGWIVVTLYDSSGNSLTTNSDFDDGVIAWECSATGKYYFLVEPHDVNQDYQVLVRSIINDPILDSDADGVVESYDFCPATPVGESVDANGCSDQQLNPSCYTDSDSDGISDCKDTCDDNIDSDSDGISDCQDTCDDRVDSDGDGISDCVDLVNNDGSSIEAAIELVSNNWVWRQTGIKKFFKFHGVEGKYYDLNVQVVEGRTIGNTKRITVFNMAGKYLAFKPGVVDSSLQIDNWPCSKNGEYVVIVESSLEDAGDIFSIHMQETDYWLGTMEYLMGAREGDGRDRYEFDDTYWNGRTIAIDEIQNRTSVHSQYDFDWVFALVEEGKTYEFRVASILNADMAFSLHGPEGGDALVYVPHVSTSFTWTASFTDFILMRLVNWNAGEYGEYSFQIVELNQ